MSKATNDNAMNKLNRIKPAADASCGSAAGQLPGYSVPSTGVFKDFFSSSEALP